ncbi:MAG TPA: SPOR domain-containing protein [Chromatiales bacterium]|nr:SPOR domain-containing protein [Chromatiales bacterium]
MSGARRRSPPGARRGASRGPQGGGWGGFLAGLALGLAVAGLVWLHYRPPAGGRADADAGRAAPRAAAPRPRFDFYTILPEQEVVIPDEDRRPPAGGAPPAGEAPGTRYMLQAGSFRRYADADRLKARLALIGIEADIQKVTIQGGETWHRVRIGPFRSRAEVDAVRARLREHRINAILLKVRG